MEGAGMKQQPQQFAVRGRRFTTTKAEVERALERVTPHTLRRHTVRIGGRRYPVKQAFSAAFGVDPSEFTAAKAGKVFERLGFDVLHWEVGTPNPFEGEQDGLRAKEARRKRGAAQDPASARDPRRLWVATGQKGGVRPRFPYMAEERPVGEVERLKASGMVLKWSPWERWEDLAADYRGSMGADVPQKVSGVYEVAIEGKGPRLVIGKAVNIGKRIKTDLVRGKGPHPAGDKIRAREDTSRLTVRWALTDRPAAAEEELHQQHVRKYGALPKYTQRT
jgi:hypothetical protein